MERRQEANYTDDPFELLKNMNDVIMAYEPKERRQKIMEEMEKGSPEIVNEENTAQTSKDQYRGTNGASQSYHTGQFNSICSSNNQTMKIGLKNLKPSTA